MAAACLRRYQVISIEGKLSVLHSRVGDDWQLKDLKDGAITRIPVATLRRRYEEGKLEFLIKDRLSSDIAKELYKATRRGKPNDIEQEEWDLAVAKLKLVKEVWHLKWLSKAQRERIRELWPKLTEKLKVVPLIPDPATVWRWWSKTEEYGWDARALLPQNYKGGRRPQLLEGPVLDMVEEALEEEYLNQLRKPREEAFKAACILVREWNKGNPKATPLALPKARQVYNHIKSIPAFDLHAARYGHANAIRRFRAVKGATCAVRPLQRVELDHTVLDLIVLHDETLLPLGRPTIAVAIDVFTRCILGIYIGFEPPSVSTVGQCLKSALLPKFALTDSIPGLVGPWNMYGLMDTLVVDQALENYAGAIDRMGDCLGIEIAWCGSKMPEQKGTVERFIGTLMRGFCHQIEGTTRSNIKDKDDYDAVGRAVCSFTAVRNGVIAWIVDKYHCHPHRSLQMAPRGKWNSTISEDDIPLATDIHVLDTLMRVPKTKPLTHKGLDCNSGLLYNSETLTDLRKEFGAELEVTIYPSPSNLGTILVEYDPAGFREEVPCLNFEYADGLTLWQHKATKRFAKEQGLGVATFEDMLKAKLLLTSIIYQGMAESPLKTRVQAARLLQKTFADRADAASTVAPATPHGAIRETPDADSGFDEEFSGVDVETY
jgi:putative transposase